MTLTLISILTTAHFAFYCAGNFPSCGDTAVKLSNYLEVRYEGITKQLGVEPEKKIEVVIHPDRASLLSARMRSDDWIVGFADAGTIHVVAPTNSDKKNTEDRVKKVAVHEITHVVVRLLNKNVPLWLNEGVATYEAGQKPQIDQSKGIKPLSEIVLIKEAREGLYQWPYAVVQFIDEKFGKDYLRKIIIDPGLLLNPSILNKLEREWEDFIRQKYFSSSLKE